MKQFANMIPLKPPSKKGAKGMPKMKKLKKVC